MSHRLLPFILLLLISQLSLACPSTHYDRTAQVAFVNDGDTIELTDGTRVRLTGINTSEIDHQQGTAEPWAVPAKTLLQSLLQSSDYIRLRYAQEPHDRYNRILAHVFLPDGTNVQQVLLNAGLAISIVVPPNDWSHDCYQQAEAKARHAKKRLWKDNPVLDITQTEPSASGFQLVSGQISHIGKGRNSIWLNAGRHFAMQIMQHDLHHFSTEDLSDWVGRYFEVRGWVRNGRPGLRMHLRHPANITLLDN